jgi:hypothetical protein
MKRNKNKLHAHRKSKAMPLHAPHLTIDDALEFAELEQLSRLERSPKQENL